MTIEELLQMPLNKKEGERQEEKGPEDTFKEACKGLLGLSLGYIDTKGTPSLRQEIAKSYNRFLPLRHSATQDQKRGPQSEQSVDIEDITLFAGAQEAIYLAAMSLLHPNDHVIVLAPHYQSLSQIAKFRGAQVTEFFLSEDSNNRWSFDLSQFASQFRSETVMAIVNFPHNPTGFIPSTDLWRQIVATCEQHKVLLFSDEVYRFPPLCETFEGPSPNLQKDDHRELLEPAVCVSQEWGISLNVLSKSFGLAGLRVGWVACRSSRIQHALRQAKDWTSICCSAPSEWLAEQALVRSHAILSRNLQILNKNYQLAKDFFDKWKDYFAFTGSPESPVAFPRILAQVSAEKFALDLVEKKKVLILPSQNYFFGDRHFRIGLGRLDFEKGLVAFDEYLSQGFLNSILD